MASSPPAADGPEPVTLPEPVRKRLVERAAARLGELDPADVPASLRRVARFEPRRRRRLAGAQIAAVLDTDEAYRASVADALRAEQPELATAVAGGDVPPAADPVDVATAAYLLRPEGWEVLLADAGGRAGRRAAERRDAAELARLREQLDTVRAEGEKEVARVTARLTEANAEVRRLRGRVHEERRRTRAAEERTEQAEAELGRARQDSRNATDATAALTGEARRLRARVAELESQVEAAKRTSRAERSVETARLAVLVDALVDSASGLRRELALPTVTERPADSVTHRYGTVAEDDSADAASGAGALQRLLATPHTHLIVDGYNVTKEGWPSLTLQVQRSRLLAGLATLAGPGRIEVTCVFDGADVGGKVPAPAGKGVRVVFSPAGVTADEVIAELVRAEPAGRRLGVVSSDGEVAEAARAAGAQPVRAAALIERLTRG